MSVWSWIFPTLRNQLAAACHKTTNQARKLAGTGFTSPANTFYQSLANTQTGIAKSEVSMAPTVLRIRPAAVVETRRPRIIFKKTEPKIISKQEVRTRTKIILRTAFNSPNRTTRPIPRPRIILHINRSRSSSLAAESDPEIFKPHTEPWKEFFKQHKISRAPGLPLRDWCLLKFGTTGVVVERRTAWMTRAERARKKGQSGIPSTAPRKIWEAFLNLTPILNPEGTESEPSTATSLPTVELDWPPHKKT